jgi:hypothetical protein
MDIGSEVPDILIEPILNLYRANTPPATISSSFNLSLEAVVRLIASQQNETSHVRNYGHDLELKSAGLRCAHSGKLMTSPVVASDGKVYEHEVLKNWLKTSKLSPVTGEPLSQDKPYLLPDLKLKVVEFSRSALSQLEIAFRLNSEEESLLSTAAEYLAVLVSDDSLMTCMDSMSYLDVTQKTALISALAPHVNALVLQKCLVEIAPLDYFAAATAELIRSILQRKEADHGLDEEFSCLIELLSKPHPSFDIARLAFDAAQFCDKEQLCQLTEALRSVCSTDNPEFAKLKLRSAELCVHEQDLTTAREILADLKKDSSNHKALIEFYDRVGWRSEKHAFLGDSFGSSLLALSNENASVSLIECLECLLELNKLNELEADVKVFKRPRRRRKVGDLAWMEFPDRIYSYTIDTGALNWVDIRSRQRDSKTIEHSFRYWCTLTELPTGNLLIAGGSIDLAFTAACTEVKELDTQTFELTVKPSMLSARWAHGSTFFEGEVYMISGMDGSSKHISQCERYNCTSETWEALPDILQQVRCTNPITVETTGCIFVFGGYNDAAYQDFIQELNLRTLTWRLLDLKLSTKTYLIPCFKLSREATDVFYVESGSLYKFDTLQYKISAVRAVTVPSEHYQGPSYYFSNMLYMSRNSAQVEMADIGELS